MKKLVKRLVSMTIVVMLVFGLMGCSTKEAQNVEKKEISKEDIKKVKLRFSQNYLNDDNLKKLYEEIFAEYEKESGVEVELEIVSGDFRVWMTTQYTANNAPDVMVASQIFSREDYKKGYVVDLGEYIDEPNPYNDNKPLSESVKESLLNQCVDPDSGKITILPYGVNAIQIVYNKNAFEKAGIAEVPKTWNEFLEVCEKLKASGIVPMAFGNHGSSAQLQWFLNDFVSQMDKSIRDQMDLNGNTAIELAELVAATDKGLIDFTKEPFSTAFEMVKKLTKYSNSDYNSTTEKQALDLWISQRVAMNQLLVTNMRDIQNIDLGFEYDVMNFPMLTEENYPEVTGKYPYNSGQVDNGYIVTKSGDPLREAAAIDFVNYMLSPKVAQKLSDQYMLMPSTVEVKLDEKFEKWLPTDEVEMVQVQYFGAKVFKAFKDFTILSSQMYLADEISQEEFLSELQKEWEKNCEKAKLENDWTEENGYGYK